ncbi:hypothetical protein AB5I41_07700 [Sphingomonas sp. MMS24-JH45]
MTGDRYAAIDANLVMETFAVLRACQRFDVPLVGLRGVSDGPGGLDGVDGWTELAAARRASCGSGGSTGMRDPWRRDPSTRPRRFMEPDAARTPGSFNLRGEGASDASLR